MMQVLSYQVADSIDIRGVKELVKMKLLKADADELFFQVQEHQFIYVFKYGVVCFLNHTEHEIGAFLQVVAPFCKNFFFVKELSEEFEIAPYAKTNKVGYNTIELIDPNVDALRLVMLNVSQSVALDYYSEQTAKLLEETNAHTRTLEQKGTLNVSGKKLQKFIGKTLNLKNRISENLYILDSPPETWEDEELNRIDLGLKRTFDLQERFKSIEESLQIVKENLELFKDIMQYRKSTLLEWIIIILILVEVLNLFAEKIFR
ncbi:RMD1 family protein [Taibaiella soli]|uniref:RMD1 family protein n=1 Tax=Taibaiella soli TaxID=1649169 RepID=A0A2W2AHS1_9BACT|nr:RMD1 family protein [Taibaiella soli]PZF74821.1 RMD1 family protein [Taibaiella soli]